ncbi:MAG: excalibur calcium-binding domain-containing protein [Rhodobacteraceae bacterium]|nr:excalibur calcium-binding domain-containing protein [Paracoccaceae bacterium]
MAPGGLRSGGLAAVAAAALLCLPAGELGAHPGGLDAEGCHRDRRSGGYHCHRAPRAPRALSPPSDGGERDPYYPNCTAARRAGAAPIRLGEPGYRGGLDRDRDGIACE